MRIVRYVTGFILSDSAAFRFFLHFTGPSDLELLIIPLEDRANVNMLYAKKY